MPEYAIAILAISLAILRIFGNYLRLRSIPGPWFTGFLSCWRWQAHDSPSHGRRLRELHERYGKLVRLGSNCVSVSDETLLRPCWQNGLIDRVRITSQIRNRDTDREGRLLSNIAYQTFKNLEGETHSPRAQESTLRTRVYTKAPSIASSPISLLLSNHTM